LQPVGKLSHFFQVVHARFYSGQAAHCGRKPENVLKALGRDAISRIDRTISTIAEMRVDFLCVGPDRGTWTKLVEQQ
jgi:hypothetical protein